MKPLHRLTLNVTGKVLLQDENQQVDTYVYQRTSPGVGNLFLNSRNDRQLRKHTVVPDNPTTKQNVVRQRFRAAVAGWNALAPAEKDQWESRVKNRPMTGYNLFIQEWSRAHPLPDTRQDPVAIRYIAAARLPVERSEFNRYAAWQEFSVGKPSFAVGNT